ncbi:hypothetical protein BJF79_45415 [Actinomadura sp. CNU-125]|uniref:hypothetical protein n=1 Tax=Actinomadura sp. CNU-125 TaxID=1904961 RepID=UPI000965B2DE|nr:hypothetical protein [Actinomadura sp. CNU-125]OLT24096.1 hypothetical protein BJF79_45415 [Actinomadura sp. CNU-125]
MHVTFERTGRRRYATIVVPPGRAPRRVDPAPGYHDHIPHDLVHYLTEAELGLARGVFGRAAAGGGSFHETAEVPGDRRARARAQRRLKKREASLQRADDGDMAASEALAGLCTIAWLRRAGAETPAWAERFPVPPEHAAAVDRILDRLDEAARLWHGLPEGGSISYTWPHTDPSVTSG